MVLDMEMSKTYQYRKVMKPMLERKRRARINKCLDELKDIMVECLTQEGEHITRLEKADILELTVEHMKKLRAQKQLRLTGASSSSSSSSSNSSSNSATGDSKLSIAESFRAGYVHAANEVSKTLAGLPGVSVDLGTQLMSHLGHRLNYLQVVVPALPLGVMAAAAAAAQQQTQLLPAPYLLAAGLAATVAPECRDAVDEVGVITPPPSECGSSDSGESSDSGASSGAASPTPSESGSMWRPW